MAIKAQDTFTEASDTNLTDHTPDTGTGWTTDISDETELRIIAADDELALSSAMIVGEGAREDTDIGDDDMDVSSTLRTTLSGTDNRLTIVSGRIPSGTFDALNAYIVDAKTQGTDSYRLQKKVAGSVTVLGAYGVIPTSGDIVKLEIRTAAKKVFLNGTERISSVDDSLIGNQFAGLVNRGAPTIDWRLDDFLSEDVGVAGRIMSSITGAGGLVGEGGIAGQGGGLAG